MSALAAPFRTLVERRLWPLAILLIAALAAVPMLLGKDGETPVVPAASAPVGEAQTAAAGTPLVSVGEVTEREAARKVLGSRKDPFKPARLPKAIKAAEPTVPGDNAPAGDDGATPAPVGGTPVTPGVTPLPVAPKKTYELYSLAVRFGETSSGLEGRVIKRLTSLPSAANPTIIYLGLLPNQKTAVFLVDSSAVAQGDGECKPGPANCQTLHLNVGETEFFDVLDGNGAVVAQYQLDLVKVKRKKTTDATAARKSYAAEARGGRRALRARMGRVGALRYDKSTGTLKKISKKAWKAAAARASAAG